MCEIGKMIPLNIYECVMNDFELFRERIEPISSKIGIDVERIRRERREKRNQRKITQKTPEKTLTL